MSVTIPIRSLTASLVITIINASIELACLSAMLIMIAANECRKLRKGEAINIRTHSFSVRLVTVIAMVMFITLEILISVNSATGFWITTKEQDCVSTREGIISENDSLASEAITMRCMSITNDVFSFRTGNYSRVDGSVQCEKNVVYKYTAQDFVHDEPISDAVIKCFSTKCAAVKAREKTLLMSGPYEKGTGDVKTSTTSFLRTNLTFDPKPILEDIAEKLVEVYNLAILDDLQIRRLVLLGAADTRCEFTDEKNQVTEIPTWIVILLLIVWMSSIFLVIVALFVRRSIFYDIHRTWDWASKTYNVPERNFGTDFYIKSIFDGSIHRIYVVSSPENENEGMDLEMPLELKPQLRPTNDEFD